MPFSLIPLLFLAIPVIEIAGFVIVGSEIGVLATIGLVFLSMFVGLVLFRIQGFGLLQKVRQDMDAGRSPDRQLVHGVMLLFAATLLIIPGFFTDIIGLLLFIPAVRDIGWRFMARRMVVRTAGMRSYPGAARDDARSTPRDRVIDLDAEDFTRKPDPNSPWKPGRDLE